jgi:hypothetical protein
MESSQSKSANELQLALNGPYAEPSGADQLKPFFLRKEAALIYSAHTVLSSKAVAPPRIKRRIDTSKRSLSDDQNRSFSSTQALRGAPGAKKVAL